MWKSAVVLTGTETSIPDPFFHHQRQETTLIQTRGLRRSQSGRVQCWEPVSWSSHRYESRQQGVRKASTTLPRAGGWQVPAKETSVWQPHHQEWETAVSIALKTWAAGCFPTLLLYCQIWGAGRRWEMVVCTWNGMWKEIRIPLTLLAQETTVSATVFW